MWWLVILIILLLSAIAYLYSKPSVDPVFKKMRVDSPPSKPLLGHAGHALKYGFVQSQVFFYNMFKEKKVYGLRHFSYPEVFVKDPEMLKEIFVKQFNAFTNRPPFTGFIEPFHENLVILRDGQWKRVRSAMSPAFSTSRIKIMSKLVERSTKQLLENLHEKQERAEEMELKRVCSCFALDALAATGYGVEVNSQKNPNDPFAVNARKAFQIKTVRLLLTSIFPSLNTICSRLGFHILNRKALYYFTGIVDNVLLQRQKDNESGRMNDFLDLISKDKEEGQTVTGVLKRSEIHGVSLNFLFVGYDTTSWAISFTLFLLAVHPRYLQRAQEEIDDKIGKQSPNYENVQELMYLNMCISEALRMYCPALYLSRQCSDDITIQGIHFRKGTWIAVPIYAIHHDPDLWEDPEEFKPERFSPEERDSYNAYAYMPFGHGPRNCLGMRLAMMELKIALAAVLQNFSPVPCTKTVYPIVPVGITSPDPRDGLWVIMEARG